MAEVPRDDARLEMAALVRSLPGAEERFLRTVESAPDAIFVKAEEPAMPHRWLVVCHP